MREHVFLCYSYFIKNTFYHTIFLKFYMYDIMNLSMMDVHIHDVLRT